MGVPAARFLRPALQWESPEVKPLFKTWEPGVGTPTFKGCSQRGDLEKRTATTRNQVRSCPGITPLAEDEATTSSPVFRLAQPAVRPAILLPRGLLSTCWGPAHWEDPVSPSFIHLWTDQA